MRPRTLVLLILVLVVLAAAVVYFVFLADCGSFLTDWRSDCKEAAAQAEDQPEEAPAQVEEATPELESPSSANSGNFLSTLTPSETNSTLVSVILATLA